VGVVGVPGGAVDVQIVKAGELADGAFGVSRYTLYEVCPESLRNEPPILMVWLHGLDMSVITDPELRSFQKHFGRKLLCLAMRNPSDAPDGRSFIWGLGYTKAQNRNGWGFIYGEICPTYLCSLCDLVREIVSHMGAEKAVAMGYSAGGLGAMLLASHEPELFSAVVPVAGHGVGTLEPPESSFGGPQPDAARIFEAFLQQRAPRLAGVPILVAIHAPRDTVSSIKDMRAIVEAVVEHGGRSELVEVPDEKANSDASAKKRKKSSHGYYHYSLLQESAEDILYAKLRGVLTGGQGTDREQRGLHAKEHATVEARDIRGEMLPSKGSRDSDADSARLL